MSSIPYMCLICLFLFQHCSASPIDSFFDKFFDAKLLTTGGGKVNKKAEPSQNKKQEYPDNPAYRKDDYDDDDDDDDRDYTTYRNREVDTDADVGYAEAHSKRGGQSHASVKGDSSSAVAFDHWGKGAVTSISKQAGGELFKLADKWRK